MGALLAALLLSISGLAAPADPDLALAEGNRLFEKEEIEAALAAYARGYAGGGSPAAGVLAYNAGTCALRLGRLPEALLWYRRAEADTPGEPWLRDNLASTRGALAETRDEGPAWGFFLEKRHGIAAAGVALAWAALGLLIVAPRLSRGLLVALALSACAAFAAGTLLDRLGPRAAVLLGPCPPQRGLPAGSEVWVVPAEGGWRIVGQDQGPLCPGETVGLVEP